MFKTATILLLTILVSSQHLLGQKPVELFPAKAKEWKQAGPGHFSIENGIATTEGGMGLWWYAGKSYQNATINVEFSLPDHRWNSGIFVRFPNPGNDPWVAVRKGYECQISGDKTGKLSTGAIYDIQSASHITLKKPGEWNHYQITTFQNKIIIVINGELVNVFTTQPGRGDKQGFFGLQNHDPKSKIRYRKITVQEWTPTDSLDSVLNQLGITQADWTKYHASKASGTKWYHKMNLGPVWANTFGDYYQNRPRVGALKGLRLELSQTDQILGLFDTENVRLSSAHQGGIHWAGTPWTGRHGTLIRMASRSNRIMQTSVKPGWADQKGSFTDTRPHPGYGNYPADHIRFNGHFRNGSSIILDYSVLGSRTLEMPSGSVTAGLPMAFRQFDLQPCDHDRLLLVADDTESHVHIDKDGRSALITPKGQLAPKKKPAALPGKISVVMDRTNDGWDKLSMGAPSNNDLVDRKNNKQTYFRVLPDFLKTHAKGGDEEGVAVRLNDGLASRNDDDVPRSFFFSDVRKPGRLEMNLAAAQDISRIQIYSHHKGNRAPQDIAIYAAENDTADPTLPAGKLQGAGWKHIATYNTRKLGDGGKHGVAILAPKGKTLGRFHKLLFISRSGRGGNMHTFFSEIDIYGEKAPELGALAHEPDNADKTYYIAVKGDGVNLRNADNGTLTLHVPAGKTPSRFSLGYTATAGKPNPKTTEALQTATPEPRELKSLTKGGTTLYPETVTTSGTLGSKDDLWTVDHLPLPIKNPWNANIRPGGFDFFSDGNSAALSTWEGDVWVVSGLKGDLKNLRWRRFATGLFETLGLKIVDDKVYVHGRDQITRLHDQNNDGEADWYECFNNDFLITKNFHEFAFSLQTDKEGNFYFVKGAPVLAGGRGFDKILPYSGTVMRISKYGKDLTVLATGLRAPGGLGVGPNGEITTGENEGTWQPCCKLNYFTGKDKFLGVEDTAHHLKGQKMHPPLCYFPMRTDNSGGGQVWVPEKSNWGLKPGELIHLSYGQSALYRVLPQEVDGTMQGGVVRIPVKLRSSAMRARFHPDSSLYVLGFRGWQTTAATPQAFHRIRHNNQPVTIPDQLKATDKGIYIRFEKKIDPSTAADRFNFKIERWKYIRSKQYGSGEFSIDNPDLKAEQQALVQESKRYRKHDNVEVASSTLLKDGKTVFLHIPSMKPAEQMSIRYKLKFADTSKAEGEIINTVHKLAPHTDNSLIQNAVVSTKTPKNLQPGLEQIISTQNQTDRRISRLPAQFVGKGDHISDMLAGHQGATTFTSIWKGHLVLTERITPQFLLQGKGTAILKINGKNVTQLGDGPSNSIQLNPGAHPFELHYTSTSNGEGQIRTLWQTDTIPLQSIPTKFFKHQTSKELAHALQLRQGRDLVVQQNCTQCHHTDKNTLPESKNQGPDMQGIGSRVSQSWLAQWLAAPHRLKPGTTMPSFVDANTEQGRKDAADMAAFLASLKAKESSSTNLQTNAAKQGGARFHMLGCIACHSLPDQPYDAQTQRVPLNNIHSKFTLTSLASFLKKPDKHHASIKMPDFGLSDEEASQLASFLHSSSKGKATQALPIPTQGDATRGKQLISQHNCASCHQGLPANQRKLPDFSTILKKPWTQHGCASTQKPGTTPKLNITADQTKLMEAYRTAHQQNSQLTLGHTSTHDFADRQFKALNCVACHARDDQPSLLASLHSQSKKLTEGVPQDEHHKVDQSRPQLTYIGEMLHTDYLHGMLDGSIKPRPRPWLAMRMPAFHSRADLLAKGLTAQHGLAPSKVDTSSIDDKKAAIGKKLVGQNGGFACNICHADGDQKPLAAFEVEGINFDQVAQRLRSGYYHRWMENPPSVTPDTKMPRYTQNNKSPLSDFENDAQKQFDAILEYFKSLEKKQQ